MIRTSQKVNAIKPSLTRKLFNMSKSYENVIDFTLGDPDIQPHDAIKKAGCQAIMLGKTRYSQNAGLLQLRERISEFCYHKNGLIYNPQTEIIATVGAMEALYLALFAVVDVGDEVIIPAPYYVNYSQMVTLCGGKPVIIEDVDSALHLMCSVESICKSITPKTKAIILNTPCNPTGQIYDDDFIAAIAKLALQHDLVVITDEVYRCLIYNSEKQVKSIATLPEMQTRTIYINSLSKEFCMTGWRIGYACGPENIIAAMTKLQENVVACAPLPSQYAAIEALRTDIDYSSAMVSIFKERLDVLIEELSKIPSLKYIVPEATFYAMVDITNTGMKSEQFAYNLLKAEQVAVVPGITYGKCCDNYIRIAFTLDVMLIREGIRRLGRFIEKISV